jgi:hypothetical protein
MKHPDCFQVLIAIDQLINTLFGGFADETLSSRAYRLELERGRTWSRKLIDTLLWFDKDHCKESYESEILRRQLPPSMR